MFLPISGSPASQAQHDILTTLLSKDLDSYKPVPVILSLGLSISFSHAVATASMDEWLGVADAVTGSRDIPFLWVGPAAAGHLKPPGLVLSQGNNALWRYTTEMVKEAEGREMEALGMYNLTLQARSWDGTGYASRVALVQAMMVCLMSRTKWETLMIVRSLTGCRGWSRHEGKCRRTEQRALHGRYTRTRATFAS